jgi:hypothetical protein
MEFCLELPGHSQGIHPRKEIPPGMTSSFTLIRADKIKMRGKSSERQQFQAQQLQILYTFSKLFQLQKFHQNEKKTEPTLLRTSYVSN